MWMEVRARTGAAESIPKATNQVSGMIVDAAFRVHNTLGPGLLERVYEVCLCHELAKRNLSFEQQPAVPIVYDDLRLETGFRLDLVVEELVIVELKAVEFLLPVHHAQLITYLKLSEYRVGLLINFNVPLIKNGMVRLAL